MKEEDIDWYNKVYINGLCGGWTMIHYENPVFLEKIWSRIQNWNPEKIIKSKNFTTQNLLDDFNKTLNDLAYKAKDVAKLLMDAWYYMKKLEEEEGYEEIPEGIINSIGYKENSMVDNRKLNGTYKNADDLFDYFEKKIIRNISFNNKIFKLETNNHYMSLRKIENSNFALVETEISGVKIGSFDIIKESLNKYFKSETDLEIKLFFTNDKNEN